MAGWLVNGDGGDDANRRAIGRWLPSHFSFQSLALPRSEIRLNQLYDSLTLVLTSAAPHVLRKSLLCSCLSRSPTIFALESNSRALEASLIDLIGVYSRRSHTNRQADPAFQKAAAGIRNYTLYRAPLPELTLNQPAWIAFLARNHLQSTFINEAATH